MIFSLSTLLIFGGTAFLVTALVAFCLEMASLKSRTPVTVKVLPDRPQHTRHLAPEYLVVSGPQAGLRKVSSAGTFPAFHAPSELVEGYLNPETNEVRSSQDCKLVSALIATVGIIGVLMMAAGVQLF